MNQIAEETAIEKTGRVIECFYQKKVSDIFPCLHPDILWIGASEGQFFYGYEIVTGQLKNLMDIPVCTLSRQSYCVVSADEMCCTIAGYYTASTVPQSGEIFSASQRLTFIWKIYQGTLRLIHMHVSNPLFITSGDIHFPHSAGRETYEYVQNLLKMNQKKTNPLQLQGKNAETYYIKPDEIIYVEADNIHSIVHTHNSRIEIHLSLNEVSEILTEQFFRIHRSFIINKNFAFRLIRYKLILKDGTALPVPEKKYKEVRTALQII